MTSYDDARTYNPRTGTITVDSTGSTCNWPVPIVYTTGTISPTATWEVELSPEQEQQPMRGLYKVYIINLKTDHVTEVGPLVAADEEAAKLKAVFSPEIKRAFIEGDTEDVMSDEFLERFDFVVARLGQVKPRIKTKKDDG